MNNKELLTNFLKERGAALVGFGNVKGLVPDECKGLNTAISIAVRLSDAVIDGIKDEPTHSYYHHYRTVNFRIDQILLDCIIKLNELGYQAMPIGASQSINQDGHRYQGLFSHRMAATRAGLGWIGKNACLVTKEFGPRVRLGTILTNLEVAYDTPINSSYCGTCTRCVEACPSIALRGNNWSTSAKRLDIVDVVACSKHMNTYFGHIGRGSVCGICIKACPIGKKVLTLD